MKKIILISGHDALAKRKTGFHFWSKILSDRGYDVRFITVGASYASLLKKQKKDLVKPYNQWVQLDSGVKKYTWLPPIHPFYVYNHFLDKLLIPIFRLYPYMLPKSITQEVRDADIFIIENGAGVMLLPQFMKASPKAKFIYNASDRLKMLNFHPVIVKKNEEYIKLFSLIRLNSAELSSDFPAGSPIAHIPQGIDKDAFDQDHHNPYTTTKNIISVGDTLFDSGPIEILADHYPEWHFHLFGKRAILAKKFKNVTEHGEAPFKSIIPYLKYADIGLATYKNHPDAKYLAQSSLKTAQYTYCSLPILAPAFLKMDRTHIFEYDPESKKSICNAFQDIQTFDRSTIHQNTIPDWNDVIDQILEKA